MLSAEEIERKKNEFWKERINQLLPHTTLTRLQLTVIEQKRGITCADCALNDECEFAWDFYNTDGDCLAEK